MSAMMRFRTLIRKWCAKTLFAFVLAALLVLCWHKGLLLYFGLIPADLGWFIKEPNYVVLSKEELSKNITAIGGYYSVNSPQVRALEIGNYVLWNERIDMFVSETGISLNEEEVLITITGGSGDTMFSPRVKRPVEIQALFHFFLYISNAEIPFNIIGMQWIYSGGGLFGSPYNTANISYAEFEELLSRTNLSFRLTRSGKAKKLARKWIKETGYVKRA